MTQRSRTCPRPETPQWIPIDHQYERTRPVDQMTKVGRAKMFQHLISQTNRIILGCGARTALLGHHNPLVTQYRFWGGTLRLFSIMCAPKRTHLVVSLFVLSVVASPSDLILA